jgi:release factor glutamine methyltransferase
LRFEPLSALASGVDGLDDIRRIISAAPQHLTSNGCLLLEHGYDQAESVRDLLTQRGFVDIFSEKDLAGIERVTRGVIGDPK